MTCKSPHPKSPNFFMFKGMSLFGKVKLFISSSQSPKAQSSQVQPKDAILKLRDTLDTLDKREKHLQQKVDAELVIARLNATKNKKLALHALKRKKLYDDQINSIGQTRLTLEQQVMAIESASVNLETMKAMEMGAKGLKAMHKDMDINKVDEIKDSIAEQMDIGKEIEEAITQPFNIGMEFDEDELDAELELLQQEEMDSKFLDTGMQSAPNVPATSIPAIAQPPRPVRQQVEDEEDAEFAELKASMAL